MKHVRVLHNVLAKHCTAMWLKQYNIGYSIETRHAMLQFMKKKYSSMSVRHRLSGHCYCVVLTTMSADAAMLAFDRFLHPFGSSNNHLHSTLFK